MMTGLEGAGRSDGGGYLKACPGVQLSAVVGVGRENNGRQEQLGTPEDIVGVAACL